MDPKETEKQIEEIMREADLLVESDIEMSASDIAVVQAKLTSLLSVAGQIYRKYEFNAMKWKEYTKSLQEHTRSMRKIIETLNTERATR